MRIYVACLASYNNGILHGRWIDATSDVESMQSEIDAMLRESKFPNVVRQTYECAECGETRTIDLNWKHKANDPLTCEHCGKPMTPGEIYQTAEEWAIHDSEGLGDISEYCGLDEIARRVEIAEVAEDHNLPISVLLEAMSDSGVDDPEEFISERYRGTYDSWADFAEELCEDCYDVDSLPDWVKPHIDWESMGRDFELSGDFSGYRVDGSLYIFWNH